MSIKDMKIGEDIIEFFIVKESEIKDAINGKYLDLILIDKTGFINAKYWKCDCKSEEIKKIKRGVIVKIKGKVEQYRDRIQLKIYKIRIADNSDNIKKDDYIKNAPFTKKEMFEKLLKTINKIKNDDIKKIVSERVNEVEEKLMYYPAAKSMHHNFSGGLLHHITSMVCVAEKLLPIYSFLNKDLVFAGIILHDLEKTEEMLADELGVESYSLEGNMIGHLVMGVNNIHRIAKKLNINKELIVIIEHIILSHHHKNDFGSPIPPLLPEGEFIHFIDLIDSKMNQLENIYEKILPGSFSEKIFSLDGRKFYKPSFF